MVPGFRREADENCALLGYYAASSGNFLPTFRDNCSVPQSRVMNPKKENFRPLMTGPIGSPETSARNYRYWLRNNPEGRSFHCDYVSDDIHMSVINKRYEK